MRIAICTNFVSPYRRPVFRELAKQTQADIRVFVSTTMEADRQWAAQGNADEPYAIKRIGGLKRTWTKRTRGSNSFDQRLERHYPLGLPRALHGFQPDVVVSGELGPRTIAATAYGQITGTPVVPWAYPPRAQAARTGATASIQSLVLRRAACVIGMGAQARAALSTLGVDDGDIFDAPNVADTPTIASRLASPEHRRAVANIRAEHTGRRIAVVVGRLVPMKGIEPLVAAWNQLDEHTRRSWRLVFVGDGHLRRHIEHQSIDDSIRIAGHVDPREVPDWFAAADLHVFGSLGDPWGLVVNEAMQCGTPTLCSGLAGCSDDLIRHGQNGLRFDPNEHAGAWSSALREALSNGSLAQLGAVAQSEVRAYTPASMARNMIAAINRATGPSAQVNRKAIA